jgi:microcystin-dependent protein
MFGFPFAPQGHAFCDGQLLNIVQNQALYSLVGNSYGGDGRTTFALPDLRGRVPIHIGNPPGPDPSRGIGDNGGDENHQLSASELPSHQHNIPGSGDQGSTTDPAANAYAGRAFLSQPGYSDVGPNNPMRDGVIGHAGAGQGHENMQPFLTINYVIALVGLFPSRN